MPPSKRLLRRLVLPLALIALVWACLIVAFPIVWECYPSPGPLTYPLVPVAQTYEEGGGSTTFRTWCKTYTVHQALAAVQGYYDLTLGRYCQAEDPWRFTALSDCGTYANCRSAACYSRGWEPADAPVTEPCSVTKPVAFSHRALPSLCICVAFRHMVVRKASLPSVKMSEQDTSGCCNS